ncbi:heme exporter protein CcmD [Caldichromatium japonicum]|uniref:Heme exporter protein D n=1 Tax=Caldichromatium japonicum TaxID=2699430 RepID=A0A6G7VER4_9GAMM|nr:heme exporter protein CcmD [Caldichromatium japonicum]QIK38464.1 heme exporter protein CcmD [Caldichromatium japonicum]
MSEFFAQGGYGFFVWGAYGMVAIVLLSEVLQLRVRQRALFARLSRLKRLAAANPVGTSAADLGQRQAE